MKKRLWIMIYVVLGALAISTPSEFRFEQRLATDYGSIHHGKSLDVGDLKAIGTSHYQSYVFFSRYHYSFGKIGVSYFGIGFMTFYLGSDQDNISTKHPETDIIS